MCECLMFVQNWNSIIILHLLLLNKCIGFWGVWGLYCKSRDNLVKLQQNILRNREHFYKTFNSQIITLQLSRFEFDVMGTEQWGYFLLLFTLLLKTWGSLCGGSWVFPERDKRFVSPWWKKFLSACLSGCGHKSEADVSVYIMAIHYGLRYSLLVNSNDVVHDY